MNKIDQVQELKNTVDEILIQQHLLSAKISVLEKAFIGVLSELHPDIEKNLYSNYIDRLAFQSREALNALIDVIPDVKLTHEKIDFEQGVRAMKSDPRYLENHIE